MPLPADARAIISQAIAHTAFSINCSVPEGGVIRMTEAIERELDAAGFVVLTRDELAEQVEEGPEEANYEEGQ